MSEDGWLEAAYEDRNGSAQEWEVHEDCACDKCGAEADEDCYPDCPYITGEDDEDH